MNILYLLFSFTTGGTERLVADICNEMAARQHQVHLYVVNDLYAPSMLESLDPHVSVQLQKRTAGSGSKLQTLFKIAQYIRKNKIDVVHCNSLDAPELLLLKPLFFPKAKILYTIHGMHQLEHKSKLQILYRNRYCDHIIAISDCVKEDVISAGADSRKVTTVYNAIDFRKFRKPCTKEFDPAQIVIGNVARIQPAVKGQDLLIRALKILKDDFPNIHCLFAGAPAAGHPEDLEQLTNLVAQLDLDNNVTFVGNIEDVSGFLNRLDVFVLPSRSEGFGISLVEAMAMGLPCVASRLEGPAEVLEDGACGVLFDPENAVDLAFQLKQLLQHYPEHKIAAMDHICDIKAQFNIQNMCTQLEALTTK